MTGNVRLLSDLLERALSGLAGQDRSGPRPIAGDEKVAAFTGLPANRRDLAGRPAAGRGLVAARWLPPRRSS